MKEYEYIVLATNEIFSHMLSSVICLESYYNICLDNSFRNIFATFNDLRNDYQQHVKDDIEETLKSAKFKMKCRYKREEVLRSYIDELKEIDNSIDYDTEIRDYYSRIEKEDVETLEMQLMVYPYLISLIRKKEESEEN